MTPPYVHVPLTALDCNRWARERHRGGGVRVLGRERRERGAGHDYQGADYDEGPVGPSSVLVEDQDIIGSSASYQTRTLRPGASSSERRADGAHSCSMIRPSSSSNWTDSCRSPCSLSVRTTVAQAVSPLPRSRLRRRLLPARPARLLRQPEPARLRVGQALQNGTGRHRNFKILREQAPPHPLQGPPAAQLQFSRPASGRRDRCAGVAPFGKQCNLPFEFR